MDISVNNPYGSYRTVTISGIEAEFDLDEILAELSDEAIVEQAKDRDLYVFESQDDMIESLVNDDQERSMLDQMDLGTVIEILGEEDILSEMDDDTIQKYAEDNNLVAESTLDDWGTEALTDELIQRDDTDAILSLIDSEMIQSHMINKRGGFTLEDTDTELLLAELGTRKVQANGTFTVTEEVAKALFVLSDFVNFIGMSEGGYEGKRFVLPIE